MQCWPVKIATVGHQSGDYVAILQDARQLKVSRRYREGLLRPTL